MRAYRFMEGGRIRQSPRGEQAPQADRLPALPPQEDVIMDLITVFVLLAMLATGGALISGISAMAMGGEVGDRTSVQWMTWRVGLQAITFLLVLLAIFGLS